MCSSSPARALPRPGAIIRIRFTKAYTERWFEIGELRINEGEYVPVYAGGDFETDAVEQQGKTPDNLLDRTMLTAWQPATNDAGALTYHVSEPSARRRRPLRRCPHHLKVRPSPPSR